MKRVEPRSVGEIIDSVFREDGNREEMLARQASFMWTEIVGPGVNRYTSRRYVSPDGILHVYITSAPLKNELSFHRDRIVQLLNERVGENVIKDIVIH